MKGGELAVKKTTRKDFGYGLHSTPIKIWIKKSGEEK
jgi:hypothetical protein